MITELEVYDAIKPKLGEDEAKMLLKFMERTTNELVTKADLLATKDDLKADAIKTFGFYLRPPSHQNFDLDQFKSITNSDVHRGSPWLFLPIHSIRIISKTLIHLSAFNRPIKGDEKFSCGLPLAKDQWVLRSNSINYGLL